MKESAAMNANIDQLLRALVGEPMWTSRRAADMATFQFGKRIKERDYYGRPSEIGEYAMHVQCAWRIVKGDAVIVGSRDLHHPASAADDDTIPEGFDWDREHNRRDKLIESFFDGRSFTVRHVTLGAAGTCRIEFDDAVMLEIFPDDSFAHEHWRLFSTLDTNAQLIVTGRPQGR
jgi:hypothetical protein